MVLSVIIVTGSVRVARASLPEALRVSLEHVRRSRAEPGCLEHSVHQDVEDPCRLFFYERWADGAALATHFAVPASGTFVRDLARLSTSAPEILVYNTDDHAP